MTNMQEALTALSVLPIVRVAVLRPGLELAGGVRPIAGAVLDVRGDVAAAWLRNGAADTVESLETLIGSAVSHG